MTHPVRSILFVFCSLLVMGLACLSYASHAAVNAMQMPERVAYYRGVWMQYHEARELKRQIDAKGLWGKPSEVLSLTIYKPEVYQRAMKLHEQELQQEMDEEKKQ